MFEPLLNHLQSLSSAEFYKALEKWQDLVEKSVHRTGTSMDESHRDTCAEEANFDVDIADYHDTVKLMEEMELVVDSVYDTEYPTGLTAKVTDVVKWKYPRIMNEQTLRGRVRRVREVTPLAASSYCYSYVIPEDLIVSLQAALNNYEICRNEDRKTRGQMQEAVDLTSTPSSAHDKTLADWAKVTGRPVEFFAEETDSSGKPSAESKQMLVYLASGISAVFDTVCLRTKFYHKNPMQGIYFEEVVGYVADRAWLNDAVLNYALDVITCNQIGVHALSSIVVGSEKFPSPPRSKLFSMKFIVLPVNIEKCHWTLILIRYGENMDE
ncbi:hypothetical protein PInf_011005 [Phytophthora infestans]|nr:hypothetical protein PInf_011005 [Phytophthora infestans]